MNSDSPTTDSDAYGSAPASPDLEPGMEPGLPSVAKHGLHNHHMHNRQVRLRFLIRHRSELLMWALVAEVLASPVADYHPRLGAVLAGLVLLLMVAAATYMASRKIVRVVIIPIALLWLVARFLEAFGDSRHMYTHLSPLVGLALSVLILWALLSRFNSVSRIPRNAIAEAFISYLVLAIAFSQLYWILNQVVETPFNQTIPHSHSGTLLYFSMITLSSVGYGGIAPVNPYVRLIAALESMAGVFYVAVVVARLVSAYRPASRS